jgi:hypothetical protein
MRWQSSAPYCTLHDIEMQIFRVQIGTIFVTSTSPAARPSCFQLAVFDFQNSDPVGRVRSHYVKRCRLDILREEGVEHLLVDVRSHQREEHQHDAFQTR